MLNFFMCSKELQNKREAIKRYEQELQSMKYLFDMTMKEKQFQSDQLQHERQCERYSITFSKKLNFRCCSIPNRKRFIEAADDP
jgi:hypothetical protein